MINTIEFNRRTNIKIIIKEDNNNSSSSSSSNNLLQNVTLNYSHIDLSSFKNSIEIAIRIKPTDPKYKISEIQLKYNNQYITLTQENYKDTITMILEKETKILMKLVVNDTQIQIRGNDKNKNGLKKKVLEKQQSLNETILLIQENSNKSSNNINTIKKSVNPTTPRRRSMTNIDEKQSTSRQQSLNSKISQQQTTSTSSKTPLASKKSTSLTSSNNPVTEGNISSTPNITIKYGSDGTKYTSTGGRLFRGGSNNNPNLDLLMKEKENSINIIFQSNSNNSPSISLTNETTSIKNSPSTPSCITYSSIPFTNSVPLYESINLTSTPTNFKKRKMIETEDNYNENDISNNYNDNNDSSQNNNSNGNERMIKSCNKYPKESITNSNENGDENNSNSMFVDQKRKRRISC